MFQKSFFSSNNPKSFCPHCCGLGTETRVSESLLVPNHDVTLRDGAILYFKGPSEGKEQKYLEAFCEHYGINIYKKFSQLSDQERHQLLYADDGIRYKLIYKEGKRRKQHYVMLRGAVPDILDKVSGGSSAAYAKYMEEIPCSVCGGAKLCKEALAYKVGEFNYGEAESMELTSLYAWLQEFSDKRLLLQKRELADQLIAGIFSKLKTLIQLDVGYLCLNRSIPTLSGGERQRVRMAAQLTCSLKGLIYILDEPCKGLHYRDIVKIIKATKNLICHGNTVIAIEHNKQYIASSDHIIELGPVGGPNGGYLIDQFNTPENNGHQLNFKKPFLTSNYFEINNINFRNIQRQNVRIPIGGITCITGVSGSGKSTLASVIARCFSRRSDTALGTMKGENNIQRVIQVNQAPIGKTPRSTIVSYLEIYDEIRTLFSKTDAAKSMKISASSFSMNVKGGRCECCQGTGLQKIELNYLPDSYITCPECEGKRFNEQVLSVKYHEKTIWDVLETPIADIVDVFKGTKKIFQALNNMIELGLGYLKLGQMSMHLSGGEAQRVKLAKALNPSACGKNLYILDEPTSGMNQADLDKFVRILEKLQQNQETIIIIEHNVEFIARTADYIIDFGILGGKDGGKIAAQGLPKAVFAEKASSLYQLDQLTY